MKPETTKGSEGLPFHEIFRNGDWLLAYHLKTNDEAEEQHKTFDNFYKIVDFLNECEEEDRELDADDIRHILKLDFDYVRDQAVEKLIMEFRKP